MTPMLERLARAAWVRSHVMNMPGSWERMSDEHREEWRGIVRAVLQELREPDEAMLKASLIAWAQSNSEMFAEWRDHENPKYRAAFQHKTSASSLEMRAAWQAGIDAALGDSP